MSGFTEGAIAPWPLVPDWSQPVTETLAWLTDVLAPSRSAASQHRALRGAPRRTLAWRALAHGQHRRLCDLLLADRGALAWLVPVWPDVQQLAVPAAAAETSIVCRTAGFDFVDGGQALLYISPRNWALLDVATVDAEALTLSDPLDSNWPAGTRLYPLRSGLISGAPEQQALTDELGARDELAAELVEACDWPAAMPTEASYRSWPVLEWRPDESEPPAGADPRTLGLVDNDTATSAAVMDMLARALRSQRASWVLHGREQQAAWRSLLYALAGRAQPVWLPSWTADLQLVQDIGASDTQIVVQWCGYELHGLGRAGSRDIRFELRDGSALCRRVTAATADADTETLSIDTALGQAVAVHQVRQICYLRLCTLASDTVQIEHVTDADGTARCRLAFTEVAE